MVSINLFEVPADSLHQEAKRRKHYLIGLLCIWFFIMGSLIGGAFALKQSQEKRMRKVAEQIESIKPRMAHYARIKEKQAYRHQSLCAAYRLRALFETPIKGLHYSSIVAKDHWKIEGDADFPRALDDYKRVAITHFESSEWTEEFSQERLHFTVQGKIAC